jgi:hypothetical protein
MVNDHLMTWGWAAKKKKASFFSIFQLDNFKVTDPFRA